MTIGKHLYKALFAAAWTLAGAGTIVLLVAAINKKNAKTCKGYRIEFTGVSGKHFVEKADLTALLTRNGKETPVGKNLREIDLRSREEAIKRNSWVKDAELYFDNNDIMRVNVTEREPVARIFTAQGASFLIDSNGIQMPVLSRVVMQLPVFTSFTGKNWSSSSPDSELENQIRLLGNYVSRHPFWMALLEQINIQPDKTFEMVPAIGRHRILFGDGLEYEKKFHRLFVFYCQILTKTGFDRYGTLDLRFDGLVIGTKTDQRLGKMDSLRAIRGMEELIRSESRLAADTPRQQNVQPLEHSQMTEQSLRNYDLVEEPNSGGDGATSRSNGAAKSKAKNPTARNTNSNHSLNHQ
jgi:cell division protein FtsQ